MQQSSQLLQLQQSQQRVDEKLMQSSPSQLPQQQMPLQHAQLSSSQPSNQNEGDNMTNSITNPAVTVKRNSIDLKLPPSKKQRGMKSKNQSESLSKKVNSTDNNEPQMIQTTTAVNSDMSKDAFSIKNQYSLLMQQSVQHNLQQQEQVQSIPNEYTNMSLNIIHQEANPVTSINKTDNTLDAINFDGYLKEGYKDETFGGVPDLNLPQLTMANDKKPTEEEDLMLSWIDSSNLDLGFDWDGDEFVKFDDNESEKVLDESGKLCAV